MVRGIFRSIRINNDVIYSVHIDIVFNRIAITRIGVKVISVIGSYEFVIEIITG
jgi:hypothetical protein